MGDGGNADLVAESADRGLRSLGNRRAVEGDIPCDLAVEATVAILPRYDEDRCQKADRALLQFSSGLQR